MWIWTVSAKRRLFYIKTIGAEHALPHLEYRRRGAERITLMRGVSTFVAHSQPNQLASSEAFVDQSAGSALVREAEALQHRLLATRKVTRMTAA